MVGWTAVGFDCSTEEAVIVESEAATFWDLVRAVKSDNAFLGEAFQFLGAVPHLSETKVSFPLEVVLRHEELADEGLLQSVRNRFRRTQMYTVIGFDWPSRSAQALAGDYQSPMAAAAQVHDFFNRNVVGAASFTVVAVMAGVVPFGLQPPGYDEWTWQAYRRAVAAVMEQEKAQRGKERAHGAA